MTPVSRSPLAARAWLAAAALLLGGCLFGGDDAPFVPRPDVLSPETDLFSEGDLRTFSWTEGLERGKRDTVLREGLLLANRLGDSIAGNETFVRIGFSSTPGAAAEASQLGLNPARLLLDSLHAIDPGPALHFPAAPVLGWRLDTTVGDLRFVRVLTRTQTLRSLGKDVQCWVFAESTYWGHHPVGQATYWLGKTGLVRQRREWKSHEPTGGTAGGTLWREIRAVKN